jgi:hypothetical protein
MYEFATIAEFNYAAKGYWRNWERQTVWLAREVVYMMIQGNPYIKSHDKPRKEDIYHLSTDPKPESKEVSKEEIEEIKNKIIKPE